MAVAALALSTVGLNSKKPAHKDLLRRVQGNILRGHGRDHMALLFLRFKKTVPRQERRRFLRELCVDRLESGLAQEERRNGSTRSFVNVFLTRAGYEALGIRPIPADRRFRRGMMSSARALNDPPSTAWEQSFRREVDAMILLAHDDVSRLHREALEVQTEAHRCADSFLEHGAALRNENGDAVEHFGYADGKSQPLFMKDDIERHAAEHGFDERLDARTGYDPSARLDLAIVKEPGGTGGYGSYLVYRKLEQNVRKFKEMEEKLAEDLGLEGDDAERAGALVVGRFEDGTPVTLQEGEGMRHPVPNNFNYAKDAAGSRCPIHAHIRRVNSRAASPAERAHRIVRRGITYGVRKKPPHVEQSLKEMPTRGVGLLFLCFQADIARQFESLQRDANGEDGKGLDPIIGQGKKRGALPQKWPPEWSGEKKLRPFAFSGVVTLKGGEYFFAPSPGLLKGL